MSKKIFFTIIICSFLLFSCSFKNNFKYQYFPYKYYKFIKNKIKMGKYIEASNHLEKIYKNYYFNRYNKKIHLQLIYVYYKIGDFLLTQEYIEYFIKKYPKYLNMDYILYIKGMNNIALVGSELQKVTDVDLFDINNIYILEAMNDFKNILIHYKNSCYLNNAKKKLAYIKNILAKYNLEIVNFYMQNKSYSAVIDHVRHMLINYPYAKETCIAINFMQESYRKLLLFNEADKISKINKCNTKNIVKF